MEKPVRHAEFERKRKRFEKQNVRLSACATENLLLDSIGKVHHATLDQTSTKNIHIDTLFLKHYYTYADGH